MCGIYIHTSIIYIYIMYLYILARWINVWRPVRMSVRPFFSWPFRFVPEAEPMEQQPQIGTLQQAGCAACPNQWGIGCKNTIYIYCILYICIYWMDLDGLNRNVIVILVIHKMISLWCLLFRSVRWVCSRGFTALDLCRPPSSSGIAGNWHHPLT